MCFGILIVPRLIVAFFCGLHCRSSNDPLYAPGLLEWRTSARSANAVEYLFVLLELSVEKQSLDDADLAPGL